MLRYLTAAFLARVDVPAVGRLPANVLAVAAFAGLGLLNPLIWIGGGVLEAVFLATLASNARFRQALDAGRVLSHTRLQLIESLPQLEQKRFSGLLVRFDRLEEIFRAQQADAFTINSNRDVLRQLESVYLRLLAAHANIDYLGVTDDTAESLRAKMEQETHPETIAILTERLANVQRRADALQQINSDLASIEAQVDLMIENATLASKPAPKQVERA